jgi:hypothetical protein
MATIVDTNTFNHFGKLSHARMTEPIQGLISDVTFPDNKTEMFGKLCEKIMTSDDDFNIVLFNNAVYHMTNQSPELVNELLIKVFDTVTKGIATKIEVAINDDSFTVQMFINLYKDYYVHASRLAKYLLYFDRRTYFDSQNKYSYIGLVKTFAFYANVINRKYEDGTKKHYLYEIFNKTIETEANKQMEARKQKDRKIEIKPGQIGNISIEEIIQLFKMYSHYIKLSSTAKTGKNELFNAELNNLFLVTLGSNQEFIRSLTQYIHDSIKNLVGKENKVVEENICEIIGLICNHFLERDMFNMYYEKLLEMRLQNSSFDQNMERKFINKFKRPDDNKIIQNMIYKLEDIEEMKSLRKPYLSAKISVKSDKYKGKIDSMNLNVEKVEARLFRHYAWSCTRFDDNSKMNIPFELAPYIDIYDKIYEKKYPYREIVWNFSQGVSVINMTFNGKTYTIEVATPQLFALLQFESHSDKISATDLASKLGISLKRLEPILKTLLITGLLAKEENKDNRDPTMLISLNEKFTIQNK